MLIRAQSLFFKDKNFQLTLFGDQFQSMPGQYFPERRRVGKGLPEVYIHRQREPGFVDHRDHTGKLVQCIDKQR